MAPAGESGGLGGRMSFRGRVYLQRPGTKIAVDLGEKDLDVRPIPYGRAKFEHDGRTEIGRIDQIGPSDWDGTGAIPKIHGVQSHGY